jgi:DNA-binding GntR family transcriptional regulator
MRSIGGFAGASDPVAGRGARESKVDRVYCALRQAIVSGELPPTSLIDKSEWSGRFGVSRLSITGAINRLAFERLIVIEPQRGSYVTKIRLTDVKQWMMMRQALEAEVAAMCAREMADEAGGRLAQNLAYQRAALDTADVQGFHELDNRFHRQMTDALGFARVGETLDGLSIQLDRVRRTLLPEPGRMEETFAEHQVIFRAIVDRRPDRAAEGMRAHLMKVLHELEAYVALHPAFFEG